MLTIEIHHPEQAVKGTAEVQIFCDTDGLSLLIRQLQLLSRRSPCAPEALPHLEAPQGASIPLMASLLLLQRYAKPKTTT
jgi:hypothetical protein